MQFSNFTENRNSLQFSNLNPSSLQSLKNTSLKAVLFNFTRLKLHDKKTHSLKIFCDKSTLEKSQLLKVQFSNSPFSN
jgi:hypothetical protein